MTLHQQAPTSMLANALRALSMDSVQKANSGHPGAPLGMADIAEVLWRKHLKHNPANPKWWDRDRFILSNGHGSTLLYALLHLSGYDISIDDLKEFRQLHSKTPGHPEFGYTPGVETTTGPLGQGIANGVGMALAEKMLAAQFNIGDHTIVDHYTYVFMGDGCLMEGISHEACSLAGTLKLGKLIAIWDDNGISIDGEVEGWFSDDTPKRFDSYGWHVISDVDGHDPIQINNAIQLAKADPRPTLICAKTIIGFGAPNKAGSHECHGAPLGDKEIALARENLDWPHAPFYIPNDIYELWDCSNSGANAEFDWTQRFNQYKQEHPDLANEFFRRVSGMLPDNWDQYTRDAIASLQAQPNNIASRKASQVTIEYLAKILPEFVGGSADLAPSNLTQWTNSISFKDDAPKGNYIHYGVREFGMTAIINGMSLHGGLLPFGATFLMFMEYARNALRMAALMKIQNIQVYTHDSIGLGEDGPTHQPIEQLASLRMTPNMSVWRPCDQVETAVAWKQAIENRTGPTALILSRQNLPQQFRSEQQLADIQKGGYILKSCNGTPQIILIATGSEVSLAVEASMRLSVQGINTQVVSIPSTDCFDKQPANYRESVLPRDVKAKIAIEASMSDYWWKYVGLEGQIIGMNTFGESAPADQLLEHFGFHSRQCSKYLPFIT